MHNYRDKFMVWCFRYEFRTGRDILPKAELHRYQVVLAPKKPLMSPLIAGAFATFRSFVGASLADFRSLVLTSASIFSFLDISISSLESDLVELASSSESDSQEE
jgi:hypothetical protein